MKAHVICPLEESLFPGGKMLLRHHLTISAYWYATNLHWGALLLIIIPSQVAHIEPRRQAQALSLILGVGAVIALVTPPIIGAFSDRCASPWGRRRPYIAAGSLINLVGLAILWEAGNLQNIWLYLVGYLVVQFGNNTASAAYSGIIPDLVPTNQRGTASGWMAVMTQTGTVLGAMGSGWLMGEGFVTESYLAIVVILVFFAGFTLIGVKERPLLTVPPKKSLVEVLKSFWIDPREYPNFAWVWITRALVTLGMWTVQPYILYYLRDIIRVKSPEAMTGYLLGTILIGATFTGLLGGAISDRIGRKRVVYVANGIIAITSVGFLFGNTLTTVFVLGALYGLGYGAYYSVDWALGCDVLPSQEDAAKDMGVWHIAMVLPQSVAPFIAGPLLAAFGQSEAPGFSGPEVHYTLAGYSAIFCLAAFFLLLGAVLLRNVRGVR